MGYFLEFLTRGDKNAPILVLLDPPGQYTVQAGRTMSDEHLDYFVDKVSKLGFGPKDFCFLTTCPFIPDNVYEINKMKSEFVKSHRQEFLQKLANYNPKVILALGSVSAMQLAGKQVAMSSVRGMFTEYPNAKNVPVLHTYNIGYVKRSPQYNEVFESDVRMLKSFVKNGWSSKGIGRTDEVEYEWCTDLSEWLKDVPKMGLATDTETTGLKHYNPAHYPFTVQFCREPGKAICVPIAKHYYPELERDHDKLILQVKTLVEHPNVMHLGHHLKFDYHMLRKLGITMTNFSFCCLQAITNINENLTSKDLAELVRIYIPEMAGYCVVPETKILTEDMRWVEAGTIEVGDELIGFDEHPEFGKRRKLQNSLVESTQRIEKPCYEITMKSGRKITVSDNHQFLRVRKEHGGGNIRWVQTKDLRLEDKLLTFPYEQFEDSYESGYMAAIFDGEGWISGNTTRAFRMGFAQNSGLVYNKSIDILSKNRIPFTVCPSNKNDTLNVYVNGWESYRALQKFRPVRLIDKKTWIGRSIPSGVNQEEDYIVELKYVGIKEVVAIKTTTHTFIAEGICSHNSDEFDQTVDKSRMIEVEPGKLKTYGCGDVDATFRLAKVLRNILIKNKRQHYLFKNVQMPALRTFADTLETNGIGVDTVQLEQFGKVLKRYEQMRYKRLIRMVPAKVKKFHIENYKGKPDKALQFSRPTFLVDTLFGKDGFKLKPQVFTAQTKNLEKSKRVPSTSINDHLPYFKEHPFVKDYMDYSKLQKLRNTYVGVPYDPIKKQPTGFWQYLNNHRIFPTYNLDVTNTGRTSSRDPNGQNFPKRGKYAKRYREVFIATALGMTIEEWRNCQWELMQADYSQAELRVIAWEANEPAMLHAYRNNQDLHAVRAAMSMGLSYQAFMALPEDEIDLGRYRAKAPNFGLSYRMSAPTYRDYAYTDYGRVITLQEAEQEHADHYRVFKGLIPWHDRCIEEAQKNKCVVSLHGHTRHLPDIDSPDGALRSLAERQAINCRIQKFASDLGLIALNRMTRDLRLNPEVRLYPAMFIHDALIFLSHKDDREANMAAVKFYMETNPLEKMFGLKSPVPFLADIEIGNNLSKLNKQKHVIATAPHWYTGD